MSQLRIVSLSQSNKMLITSNKINSNSSIGTESDSELSDAETIDSNNENQIGQKRKRQRLTHLTPEEKMMRRKLKNRVAAQSARDRKKVKMDDLEDTCKHLKDHNDKLLKENQLLKEKAKILIDENRRLLKFKTDTEKSTKSMKPSHELVKIAAHETKTLKQFVRADESAVFTKYASQPKRQLYGMFQQIVFMLILQTMNLIKQEMSSPQSMHIHKSRISKLRITLSKLFKLAIAKKMLPKAQNSIQVMNTFRKSKNTMNSLNLALLISMIVKSLETKRV